MQDFKDEKLLNIEDCEFQEIKPSKTSCGIANFLLKTYEILEV